MSPVSAEAAVVFILQFDNDLRDVSGFQFNHALPIDDQCIIGAALNLLGFIAERNERTVTENNQSNAFDQRRP